ncbi:HEXXH motif-containing putative peptide modification protein [Streptomyces albidoflavus]|uniref:aKG-HExxH-type peptide beta-hydroxylase n=1 Tax=Streptomyces albidoflavus TaxID=1886 RepID=UPI0033BAA1A9
MSQPIPHHVLYELGCTEGSPATLRLLARDQDRRRLLLLRAVLDAADAAGADRCPPAARRGLAESWALLEAAERATPDRGATVRSLLLAPLVGPWAEHALALLTGTGPPDPAATAHALAHLAPLAAAAAVRAGLPFRLRLTATGGTLALPTLGALRTGPGTVPVDAHHSGGRLVLRADGPRTVTVRPQRGHGAWAASPAWRAAHALPPLLPGGHPVSLDDLDPYRVPHHPDQPGFTGITDLDDLARKRWGAAWSGAAAALGHGGPHRISEAVTLLRCLVPLAPPGGGAAGEPPPGSCSGTRREAFGAVLSSEPPDAAGFAETLVHETQHIKLAALAALAPLHHADPAPRHFAPWRPDPRPFDGLWHGVYSHLALADWWLHHARALPPGPGRERAWAEHARRREQVGAALPVLVGSDALTPAGRTVAEGMVTAYTRLTHAEVPADHLARAVAYVATTRALWLQRQGGTRPS